MSINENHLKKRCIKKLNEIHSSINNLDLPHSNCGLLGGKAGILLFISYYNKFISNVEDDAYQYRLLEEIVNELNDEKVSFRLSDGLSGIGLVFSHLTLHNFIDIEDKTFFKSINSVLYDSIIQNIKNNRFDYLHGALGGLLYYIETNRFNDLSLEIDEIITLIINKLDKDERGYKLLFDLDLFGKNKAYNISISHGLSSLIRLFSKVNTSIKKSEIESIVTGLIGYLLSQKLPEGKYESIYPNLAIESTEIMHSSRLAWCYGDLGISVTLWHASQVFKRFDWEQEAVKTIKHACKRRNLKQNGVLDTGLCHGTAGIAHIFNRMYGYTGLEECKHAAEYWFDQTIKMANFEDGLAGFKAWHGEEKGWVNEPGLLEGVAGIGLALISYISDIEPAWDECLLIS